MSDVKTNVVRPMGRTATADHQVVADSVFPDAEMTDGEFEVFSLIENNEISISKVNFRKPLRTVITVL